MKLTKLEQTVLNESRRGADFLTIATQLNRSLASIATTYRRATRKLAAVPVPATNAETATPAKQIARALSSIDVQRRFGGFLAVLIFSDGEQENVGDHVVLTAQAALQRAEAWIATPAYNIKWWTDV